jgi:hypothetical protein
MIALPYPSRVLLLTVLFTCACAGSSSGVREAASQHVYSQQLPQLWPQVEAFMTEQGYTWRSAPRKYVLRTEWRENGTSGASRMLVSYLVQGEPHPSGGCVLRVSRGLKASPNDQSGDLSAMHVPGVSSPGEARDRLSQNEVAMTSQRAIYAPARDLDMELALMRKMAPAAAARLEKPASTASP